MDSKNNCSGCADADKCSAAYELAGKAEGPSVVWKVILAFLFPIIIFIVILALCEQYLPEITKNPQIRTGMGALLAFTASLIYIFGVRIVRNFCDKSKCSAVQKEK